jgi:hypothetical protein
MGDSDPMWFTWPYIMVPMNIINVYLTWRYLEWMYPENVYCWEEGGDLGLSYYCEVYGQ